MNDRSRVTTEELPLPPSPQEDLIVSYNQLISEALFYLERNKKVPEVSDVVERCEQIFNRFSAALNGFLANHQSGGEAYFTDFDRPRDGARSVSVPIALLHTAAWVDRELQKVKQLLSSRVLSKARIRCLQAINVALIGNQIDPAEKLFIERMESATSLEELKKMLTSPVLSDAARSAANTAMDAIYLDTEDPVLAINNLVNIYIRTAEQRRSVAIGIEIGDGMRKFEAELESIPRYKISNRPDDQQRVYTIGFDQSEKPTLVPGTDNVFGLTTTVDDRKYVFQVQKRRSFSRQEGTSKVISQVVFEVVGIVPSTKAEQKYFRALNKKIKANPEVIDPNKSLECVQWLIYVIDGFNRAEADKITMQKVQSLAIANRRTIGGLALGVSLALAAIAVKPSFEGRHQTSVNTVRARSAATPHGSHSMLNNSAIDASGSMDSSNASVNDIPYIDANDVEAVVDASVVADVVTVSPVPNVPVLPSLPIPTTASAYGTFVGGFNVAHSYQANAEFAVRHILTSNPILLSGTHLRAATVANYWASLRSSSPLQTARHDSSTGVLRHTHVGDRFELYRQDNGSFNLIQLRGSTQNRVIHVDSLLDGKNAANDELRSSQGHTSITPEALPDSGRASYDACDVAHLDNVYMSPDSMDYQQIVPAHHVASYTARESSAKQSAAQRPARGLWGRVKSFFGFDSKTQHKRYIDQDSAEYRTMIADRTDNTYADPETARRLITNHTAKPRSWLSKLVQSLFR